MSFGLGASTGAAAGFGFGASTGAAPAASFGAPAAAPAFGSTPAATTGGGFGSFGAPAATGTAAGGFGAAAGGFGATTGAAFGAATAAKPATGGFGGFGASAPATTGGFGAFGAPAASGTATGGGFGSFGAPATTGAATGGFGAFGAAAAGGAATGGLTGFGGFGAAAPAAGAVTPAQSQAPLWPTIKWRDTFKNLPKLLQAKMEQHHNMVEDCKERNSEIRTVLDKRRAAVSLASAHPGDGGYRPVGGAAADDVEDSKAERTASRLRHCLAALKMSLQHDSGALQRQQEHVARQKQLLSTLHPLAGSNSSATPGAGDPHAHERSLLFLQEMARELQGEIEHMKDVMIDLDQVLVGSINRPSQYPPELIEQVLWQSERLWHAMSAKVALLHAQVQRSRHAFTALLRSANPSARDPLAQSETLKIVLQVCVTGLKFNQSSFIEALAHKCAVKSQRMRLIQVDPMDNAVVVCVEDDAHQGLPAEQVANTLRRLFAQGDIDLATYPLYCFALQVGRDDAIIHPAASPHIDEAEGLDADMVAQLTAATTALPAAPPPGASTGAAPGLGAGAGTIATGAAFGGFSTATSAGATGGGFGGFGASGATPAAPSAFGAPAAATGGGFGSFGAPAATGAATGGFGAAAGGFGAATGGFGAAGGGFGAATGGATGGFGFGAAGGGFGGFGAGSTRPSTTTAGSAKKKTGR